MSAGGHTIDGDFTREITLTDRVVHLPTAARALMEESQELNEFQSRLAARTRVVQETEARHVNRMQEEAREVMQRAAMGRLASQELDEYQNQLAARTRVVQETEVRHMNLLQDEARAVSYTHLTLPTIYSV